MIVEIKHRTVNFDSYRANRVKSLFNAENGHYWEHTANLPIENLNWQIGVIVGPSGSGKTSLGKKLFPEVGITDLYSGWHDDRPIIDDIAPEGDFNQVTAALAAVGLGSVPSWLRPFKVLSNGEKFRAGLARLIVDPPEIAIIDEFTSVLDRQIAKIGAAAFSKAWRRLKDKKVILLSPHYDILEWLEPDWYYDTAEARFVRDRLRRPKINLEIRKVNGKFWKFFKQHYYLDLPYPPAAEYFIGTVDGELVAHLAVAPLFTAKAYRATRLVVMPEWQGVGIGMKFLNFVCQWHLEGNGRKGYKYPTFFHTSHPQLAAALRRSKLWIQTGARLYGANKKKVIESIKKTGNGTMRGTGYGGHFRAIQSFKYIGNGN